MTQEKITLISGRPGSGKTTKCKEIAKETIDNNKPLIFINQKGDKENTKELLNHISQKEKQKINIDFELKKEVISIENHIIVQLPSFYADIELHKAKTKETLHRINTALREQEETLSVIIDDIDIEDYYDELISIAEQARKNNHSLTIASQLPNNDYINEVKPDQIWNYGKN